MKLFLKKNKYYLSISGLLIGGLIFRPYFNGPVCKHQKRLDNKLIVVTGASDGIGKEMARVLLNQGATVILACRNKEKTDKFLDTLDEIIRKNAIYMQLDLNSFTSLKTFIANFKEKFDHLDILINNAGLINDKFTLSSDGLESTIQVNNVSPMILTQELLNLISKSNGRIINVASDAYIFHKLFNFKKDIYDESYSDFKDLKSYWGAKFYCFVKFGNIMFTQYLADYIKSQNLNVKVASAHPGVVITNLINYNDHFLKILFYPLINYFGKDARMGAQPILHLCYIDDKEFITGKYYKDNKQCKLRIRNNEEKKNEYIQFIKNYVNYNPSCKDVQFYL